eukprot:4036047-Prymnesium_polylepis.1
MAAFDRWRRIRSRCPRGCGQGDRAPASWFPGRLLAGQRCKIIQRRENGCGIQRLLLCIRQDLAVGGESFEQGLSFSVHVGLLIQ